MHASKAEEVSNVGAPWIGLGWAQKSMFKTTKRGRVGLAPRLFSIWLYLFHLALVGFSLKPTKRGLQTKGTPTWLPFQRLE